MAGCGKTGKNEGRGLTPMNADEKINHFGLAYRRLPAFIGG